MRAVPSILVSLLLVSLLSACGPSVLAFEISEVVESDCSQTESDQVNCVEPSTFADVKRVGRWTVELVGSDKFVLTTEEGRVLLGVFFANTGAIQSETCTGQGGTCYFARSRTDTVESSSGCVRIVERVIDVIVQDGALAGARSDVQFVDECDASNIRQVLVNVEGTELEEPLLPRENL